LREKKVLHYGLMKFFRINLYAKLQPSYQKSMPKKLPTANCLLHTQLPNV
jgi:hypothetical protein